MWVENIQNCIRNLCTYYIDMYKVDIYQKRVFWPAYAVSTCCFYFQILTWEEEEGASVVVSSSFIA